MLAAMIHLVRLGVLTADDEAGPGSVYRLSN
jgi:hypothetical protein